ncbi:aminoacyl-tRNA deacylase [Hydrogenophaga crocea]|uniref:YbaK/aminoacyl-tRNA synthetase-associated domain-containing protein n=1 Tax=Hydrogenophaga crocea TaxID=2716225 RepID=A0A6G8IC74_9BURK|nr:YbaK/EbsC family protein [Hydrogenophaga crocea]QIM50752.1 hypothetical protein G9Q37_00695 [Hydrogenophaga crocea]
MDRHGRTEGLVFELIELDHEAPTASAASEQVGCPVEDIVKTLLFEDDAVVVAAVLAGSDRVDRRKLQRLMGSTSLRLCSHDRVIEHTGYLPGGVAPMGFYKPTTVVIDRKITLRRSVITGGGTPRHLMRIAVDDLIAGAHATVEDIAEKA